MLAAVGPMQLEVAAWRLEHEFGAATELSPTLRHRPAHRRGVRPDLQGMPGVRVLARADGTLYALFESPYWLARVESDNPELTLDRPGGRGTAGQSCRGPAVRARRWCRPRGLQVDQVVGDVVVQALPLPTMVPSPS